MDWTSIRREAACCFTGHRPDKLPGGYAMNEALLAPLRQRLRRAIQEAVDTDYRDFLCGMALGADTLAAQEVLALRDVQPELRLIAAIPCPDQAKRWKPQDQRRYRDLLDRADGCYTACPSYTPYAMGARNLWMVEHASRIIAVTDGSPGGTANTLRMAEDRRLTIVRIVP